MFTFRRLAAVFCSCALIGVLSLWPTPATGAVHTVRQGENLSLIASRYGVTVAQLRQWNALRSDRLLVGQPLEVKGGVPTTYRVRRGDTLSEIAQRFGVSLAGLRRANGLKNDRIRPGQTLRLQAANTPSPTPSTHTVRRGENLSHIAKKYGLKAEDLIRLNGLKNDRIQPGQKLKIATATPVRTATATQPRGFAQTHTVRRGENLSRIAKKYGLKAEDLIRLNGLKNDRIQPGQKLKIAAAPASPATEEPQTYTVRRGDTLSEIALRFDVGLHLLRSLNGLRSDRISPGQTLRLRPDHREAGVHIVQKGETLSQIALSYGIDAALLRDLNGIEGSRIYTGQKLRLKATDSATHLVERGDALWEIARAYGMDLAELKELNGLRGDAIYPGQVLKLNVEQAQRLDTYTVRRGDNLSEIARLHQMSLAELRRLNQLRGSVIHPGDRLKVKPLLGDAPTRLSFDAATWKTLLAGPQGARSFNPGNGPYFFRPPRASSQKHSRYYESPVNGPYKTYRQAAELWRGFERAVDGLKPRSRALKGWKFVLDPGHGGADPGTVVPVRDGNGKTVYVVEDEYVYDIALRLYVLLRLNGAAVHMTLLSPNHLIRHNDPIWRTFVNEKNEVYNSLAYNRRNGRHQWPKGGRSGNLETRVSIARYAFRNAQRGRRVFISIHADRDPKGPRAPLVLYYQSRSGRNLDRASRDFARSLLPAMGAGSKTRGQSLGVLRNNPADVKVLLEMRNLAYADHAWALRYEQMRQRDAEKILKGLLDYSARQSLRAGR